MATKQFVSAYQGASHYLVNGTEYSVRTFAIVEGSHCSEMWPTIQAEIGTVRASHWPDVATFPPAEVMSAFPGYVAARIVASDGFRVEYNGSAPATYVNPRTGWIEADLSFVPE